MVAADRRPWLGAAILAGVLYFLVGTLFALPAAHVQAWRLAAWAASGLVYAAHLGYEHLGRRSAARAAALHAALAVAIGALGLALRGALRSWSATGAVRPAWLIALIAWPAITAVPAFLVGLAAGVVLARLHPGAEPDARAPLPPAAR